MTDQTPEPELDPFANKPDVEPADDGLGADAPEHDAEDPAPPDDGPDDETHPADPETLAELDEGETGGEG